MALPLDVHADLQLAVDGEHVAVQADGKRIVVDLATIEAGRNLLSSYPLSVGRHPQPTDRLHEALEISGLTIEVRLRGQTIARLGKDAQPGRLARLFNLDGIELRPAKSLQVVARKRPFLTAFVIGGVFALVGWIIARLWRS